MTGVSSRLAEPRVPRISSPALMPIPTSTGACRRSCRSCRSCRWRLYVARRWRKSGLEGADARKQAIVGRISDKIRQLDQASEKGHFERAQLNFYIARSFGLRLGRGAQPLGFWDDYSLFRNLSALKTDPVSLGVALRRADLSEYWADGLRFNLFFETYDSDLLDIDLEEGLDYRFAGTYFQASAGFSYALRRSIDLVATMLSGADEERDRFYKAALKIDAKF